MKGRLCSKYPHISQEHKGEGDREERRIGEIEVNREIGEKVVNKNIGENKVKRKIEEEEVVNMEIGEKEAN